MLMKTPMRHQTIAIVGPTASGKSDLAIDLALKTNAVILSLDSLAVYKEIDIASAKPTLKEQAGIKHFGIDVLFPNEKFDVMQFLALFRKAQEYANQNNQPLIITGGSSFYLKTLTDGISPLPTITKEAQEQTQMLLKSTSGAYSYLQSIDPAYCQKITHADRYRLQKALEIYFATKQTPTDYFRANPPKPLVDNLPIYAINTQRALLRERIAKRTQKMLQMGLIDEVAYLERTYTRAPQSMGAIGIAEVLKYLDGRVGLKELEEKIIINTARLAKRQVTFNKSQLNVEYYGSIEEIKKRVLI